MEVKSLPPERSPEVFTPPPAGGIHARPASALAAAALPALLLAAFLALPAPASADTLRLVLPAAPRTLDPHAWPPDPGAYPVVMNAYRRLFDLQPGQSVLDTSASLARTARISDDGLSYIIILKEGESFADGAPVTPESVLFTLDRLMASDAGKALFPHLRFMRIDGPYTLTLILDRPWPPFLASLALPQASIISPALAGRPADHLKEHSLGSGRYIAGPPDAGAAAADLRGPAPGTVLVRRPDLNAASSPERVEIWYEPDPGRRLALYREKGAHLTPLPGPLPLNEVPEGSEIRRYPTWTTRYLAFNSGSGYLGNPLAREAAGLAAEHAFAHMPLRPLGLLPLGFAGAPPPAPRRGLEVATADERARELFQAAGPPPSPLTVVCPDAEEGACADARILAERLGALRVPANVRPLVGAQGQGILERGDYDIYLGTRHPEIPSPEMWLGRFLDSRAGVRSNPARYADPAADSLIDGFDASLGRPEREARVKSLAAYAAQARPYVLLYQIEETVLADRRLSGLTPHPMWPLYWPFEKADLNPFRAGARPHVPQGPPPAPVPEPVRDFDETVFEPYE
ncbi:MAG: ABC transporter substrate-binding protein [Deltaproteobacteria bacterium]|jgi:peptide/nickel transport system substrate-binding protein|nr:ABC transporter substrate-binding protein [Deltaproteobacteria bacterium]